MVTREELVRALEAELATGYPPPDTSASKRARLLELDDELRPAEERWSTSTATTWVHALGGRICDLSPRLIDAIALRVPQTRQIRQATEQVNRRSTGGGRELA